MSNCVQTKREKLYVFGGLDVFGKMLLTLFRFNLQYCRNIRQWISGRFNSVSSTFSEQTPNTRGLCAFFLWIEILCYHKIISCSKTFLAEFWNFSVSFQVTATVMASPCIPSMKWEKRLDMHSEKPPDRFCLNFCFVPPHLLGFIQEMDLSQEEGAVVVVRGVTSRRGALLLRFSDRKHPGGGFIFPSGDVILHVGPKLPFFESLPAEWSHSEVSRSTSLNVQGASTLRAAFSKKRRLTAVGFSFPCNPESSPATGNKQNFSYL